ncbi:unnamed protein product [Boreogadus saida]
MKHTERGRQHGQLRTIFCEAVMKVFSLLYLLLVLVALLASVSSVRPEESLMRKNEVVKSLAGAVLGRKDARGTLKCISLGSPSLLSP